MTWLYETCIKAGAANIHISRVVPNQETDETTYKHQEKQQRASHHGPHHHHPDKMLSSFHQPDLVVALGVVVVVASGTIHVDPVGACNPTQGCADDDGPYGS